MPFSSHEGKADFIVPLLTMHRPIKIVLDIGPGSGTYVDLLREHLPEAEFIGIEIFEPYVDQYKLRDKYDELIIGNALDVDFPKADVVILGDVVEHVERDDAIKLWMKARRAAKKCVIMSLPIVDFPQGAEFGNEHEAHLYQWKHDEIMESFIGITSIYNGEVVGVYEGIPLIENE